MATNSKAPDHIEFAGDYDCKHIFLHTHTGEVIDIKKSDNSQYLNAIEKYKNILIIDDINDTGRTLQLVKNLFSDRTAIIKYAVLVDNKSSNFVVDFAAKNIDKKVDNAWIVFTWEEMR